MGVVRGVGVRDRACVCDVRVECVGWGALYNESVRVRGRREEGREGMGWGALCWSDGALYSQPLRVRECGDRVRVRGVGVM